MGKKGEINLHDPKEKSIYFYISNEVDYEQTVNLDFKIKWWERRMESQCDQLLR